MDDEDDTAEAANANAAAAPEGEAAYEFEGFDIQVNERIALTPAAARGTGSRHG